MIPNLIQNNATTILRTLAEQPRPEGGNAELSGSDLAELTGLTANEINDAIAFLLEAGLAEWLQTLGTGPYDFNVVWITPRGRFGHVVLSQGRTETGQRVEEERSEGLGVGAG